MELDVRRAADGALVVRHDGELPDGRAVTAVRAADLPPDIPLLDAALDACDAMGVNVEIKPHDGLDVVEPVLAAIRAWGGDVIMSSFDFALVDRSRAIAPDIATAWLVLNDPLSVVDACAAAGHTALHPWDPMVDASLVQRCHAAGLAVNVWTVDDPDRIADLASWGVDGIVTNVPDVARTAIARE